MHAAGTVAFIAFWLFVAIMAVFGMSYDYRKRRLEMESLRTAIEHGQHLDPAVLEKLLAGQRPPRDDPQDLRPYLHIGGIITIAAGVGLLLAGLWVGGMQFPVAEYPLLAFGAFVVCIGIGLLVAVHALKRYPSPERSPDRTA